MTTTMSVRCVLFFFFFFCLAEVFDVEERANRHSGASTPQHGCISWQALSPGDMVRGTRGGGA